MKKMSWGRFFVVVLSASMLFTACSKKDGKDGAQGPAGTANVIYSAWQDVTFAINSNQTAYVGVIAAPKIVDSIVQKGDVKVFMTVNPAGLALSAGTTVTPLPYTLAFFTNDSTSVVYSVYPVVQAGKISLIGNYDFSTYTSTTDSKKYWQYRYVVIPPGVSARSAVDWNDYAQVKEYFHLQD